MINSCIKFKLQNYFESLDVLNMQVKNCTFNSTFIKDYFFLKNCCGIAED